VVYPINFKVAYAFAAIPARFALENKDWAGAAKLPLGPAGFPWAKFPWQESIVHFTRLLGAAHLGNGKDANTELTKLQQLQDTLVLQKDSYKSGQVAIQIKAGEAWIALANGNKNEAIRLMNLSAEMEDKTEKHPVTPGEVLPAKELLADMLLQAGQYQNALLAYEAVLQKSPNRFNSLVGAGLAAEKLGDNEKAIANYKQVLSVTGAANAERSELNRIRLFLGNH